MFILADEVTVEEVPVFQYHPLSLAARPEFADVPLPYMFTLE